MKALLIGGLILAFLAACEATPEPLAFGKDFCHTCKMTLMDEKFGAELVTAKGKVYKFDDMNCMLGFYHSGFEDPGQMAHVLVVDFSNPGKLIDARQAWYLKSESIHSPMAGGLAAFESEAALQPLKKDWGAILMSWGEVNTQFK